MGSRYKEDDTLITFRGILLPMDWGENGEVISIGLSGEDENDYLIESSEEKVELLNLTQRAIEVSGKLRYRSGKKVIVLRKYRLV